MSSKQLDYDQLMDHSNFNFETTEIGLVAFHLMDAQQIEKYFRSLFHNTIDDDNDDDDATAADAAAATDADDHDHVTVIALSSLHDERANTDAWINNLENIYHNLVEQKSFRNIRLILINSKDSYNPLWVNRIRKKVSFEVYQELSSSPIANQLDGHSGDVYIFDR